MMHSKAKGAVGEAKIAADLLSKGYRVFFELGDLSKIDLIAEKDKKLYTFQVKAYNSKNGSVELCSRKCGPNYIFHYDSDDVDIFAVYVLDCERIFYVPSKELCEFKASMKFRIEPAKNNQKKSTRNIEDYTLERILRD